MGEADPGCNTLGQKQDWHAKQMVGNSNSKRYAECIMLCRRDFDTIDTPAVDSNSDGRDDVIVVV
jgi:hypothetical protein